MAKWALVENNVVLEHHDQLPRNWKNHSGLYLSENNIEFLNSIGWYEVEYEEVEFNPDNFRVNGHTFTFNGTKVIAHAQLHEITEEERQASIPQPVDMRAERNQKLQESDWTMYPDVIEKYGQEWYVKWKTYRQALRDLPQVYPNGIYFWPELPV